MDEGRPAQVLPVGDGRPAQVLPVGDGAEAVDLSRPPTDALEYLRQVR